MARTCLLITDCFEPTADLLLTEMRRRGVPCVRWNLDRFPMGSALTYRVSGEHFSAEVSTDGRRVELEAVGSIWCRGFRPSGMPEDLDEFDRRFVETESQRALDALLTITTARWVNHPQAHLRANSKPAQLFTARRVGLEIPPTVITNDPEEVRAFTKNSAEDTVYKAMSQSLHLERGKALFTAIVTEKELANIDLIQMSPGIFQKRVPKAYEVRATVVGSRIFSGKINSQSSVETQIDWRHRPFDIEQAPIQLPADVEAKIHDLMNALGLVYGALDLIVTPEGRYVFLEVNPAGQYMWVEAKTGLPITAALADVLCEPCRA